MRSQLKEICHLLNTTFCVHLGKFTIRRYLFNTLLSSYGVRELKSLDSVKLNMGSCVM